MHSCRMCMQSCSEIYAKRADNQPISVQKIVNFESTFSNLDSNFFHFEQVFWQFFCVLEQLFGIFLATFSQFSSTICLCLNLGGGGGGEHTPAFVKYVQKVGTKGCLSDISRIEKVDIFCNENGNFLHKNNKNAYTNQ